MTTTQDYWRKCTSCKSPLSFGAKYWVCSVSTCNRARTDLVFCQISCFDAHVPVMNHRDAGAIERRAPTQAEWVRAQTEAAASTRAPTTAPTETPTPTHVKREILVVVSKTKDYVRTVSGMNTSDAVMEILSDKIREHLDSAIRSAQQAGRKTVMDRDFS